MNIIFLHFHYYVLALTLALALALEFASFGKSTGLLAANFSHQYKNYKKHLFLA